MALQSDSAVTAKLIGFLLTPSWLSSTIIILISTLVVGGTLVLTKIGSGTQQSLLGLHSVYQQSSINSNASVVGEHLSGNLVFNNSVLFILWGSVGLVVYSVIQGIVAELTHTHDVLQEMNYVHADRQKILHDAILKAVTRFAALAGWWALVWIILHKIFPYAIASAHITGYNLSNTSDWLHTLLGFGLCLLSLHGLTVLLRLIVLRPRVTGNEIL